MVEGEETIKKNKKKRAAEEENNKKKDGKGNSEYNESQAAVSTLSRQ